MKKQFNAIGLVVTFLLLSLLNAELVFAAPASHNPKRQIKEIEIRALLRQPFSSQSLQFAENLSRQSIRVEKEIEEYLIDGYIHLNLPEKAVIAANQLLLSHSSEKVEHFLLKYSIEKKNLVKARYHLNRLKLNIFADSFYRFAIFRIQHNIPDWLLLSMASAFSVLVLLVTLRICIEKELIKKDLFRNLRGAHKLGNLFSETVILLRKAKHKLQPIGSFFRGSMHSNQGSGEPEDFSSEPFEISMKLKPATHLSEATTGETMKILDKSDSSLNFELELPEEKFGDLQQETPLISQQPIRLITEIFPVESELENSTGKEAPIYFIADHLRPMPFFSQLLWQLQESDLQLVWYDYHEFAHRLKRKMLAVVRIFFETENRTAPEDFLLPWKAFPLTFQDFSNAYINDNLPTEIQSENLNNFLESEKNSFLPVNSKIEPPATEEKPFSIDPGFSIDLLPPVDMKSSEPHLNQSLRPTGEIQKIKADLKIHRRKEEIEPVMDRDFVPLNNKSGSNLKIHEQAQSPVEKSEAGSGSSTTETTAFDTTSWAGNPASESFIERLAATLCKSSDKAEKRVFAVTSAVEIPERTSFCFQLGKAFAKSGKRTLIIDADFDNPRLNMFTDMPCLTGLKHLLKPDKKQTFSATQTEIENLKILVSGSPDENARSQMNEEFWQLSIKMCLQKKDVIILILPAFNNFETVRISGIKPELLVLSDEQSAKSSRELKYWLGYFQKKGYCVKQQINCRT
ncbi:MAG: hypothetical protein ACOYXC_07245 [Candidatus Rifleibacteriota bacterium]